jgi:hypothetical protein
MKKIILFKGEVETLEYFSLQLAKVFTRMGHKVFIFDFLEERKSLTALLSFVERNNTVMITFNFTGIRGDSIFIDKEDVLFWNEFNIPCYNIVVDHPFYYHQLINVAPKWYYHISIDRFHESYMKRFFPETKSESFLPLGGTQIFEKLTPYEERTMDIVFTGNYTPPSQFDKFITRIDDNYTAFYHSIIDDLIAHPLLPMEEAFENHIKMEIEDSSEEDIKACMESFVFIDLYVRSYFRGLVVKTLVDSGLKVHVFGSGWNLLDCKHPENIINGENVGSETCLVKISQAKISLNVMPWFKDGAHDRIFNSMLNGALSLSDSSIYLEEELQDGVNVKFYSLSEIEKLPDMVSSLLNNPVTVKKIIAAGYQKALNHTWEKRAQVLEEMINRH